MRNFDISYIEEYYFLYCSIVVDP